MTLRRTVRAALITLALAGTLKGATSALES